MFRPHTPAFACLLLLLLLNICFSSGKKSKKSTKRDLPVETEWGSIEGLDTSCETIFIIYILEIITKESRKKKMTAYLRNAGINRKPPARFGG